MIFLFLAFINFVLSGRMGSSHSHFMDNKCEDYPNTMTWTGLGMCTIVGVNASAKVQMQGSDHVHGYIYTDEKCGEVEKDFVITLDTCEKDDPHHTEDGYHYERLEDFETGFANIVRYADGCVDDQKKVATSWVVYEDTECKGKITYFIVNCNDDPCKPVDCIPGDHSSMSVKCNKY